MGYTANSRTGIFAHRAAPIHVSYLGFPATMGAPYIDYLVADEIVIPPGSAHDYAERIAWLPGCFQANDPARPAAAASPTRARAGLPEHGIVLACFNAVYKIGPRLFDAWMRVVAAVPDCVLWLVVEHPAARVRLREEAARRGVDPRRLVFAPRLPYEQYLAQLALADLFLDTLPFNAGTTASDALWMGVPVLTCPGRAYAARMASSLVDAVGLSTLVTTDEDAYVARAIELARDPPALAALRARFARDARGQRLFDLDAFRAHLEAAFTIMVARHRRGEAPDSFRVPRER